MPRERSRAARSLVTSAPCRRAEVGLDDLGSVATVAERALRDLDAVIECDHTVGDPLDDVHVVLDDEDRVAALGRGACAISSVISCVSAGFMPAAGSSSSSSRGFVGRRAGDLEPAAVRVREAVRGLVPAVAHQPVAEEGEPLLRELARSRAPRAAGPACAASSAGRPPLCARRRRPSRSPARSCSGRGGASGTCARSRDRVIGAGRGPTMLLPSKQDVAARRVVDARDQVEERRLAGAVRPDDADDLAFVDVEVEVGRCSAGRRKPSRRPGARAASRPLRRSPRARSPKSPAAA